MPGQPYPLLVPSAVIGQGGCHGLGEEVTISPPRGLPAEAFDAPAGIALEAEEVRRREFVDCGTEFLRRCRAFLRYPP